jgi:hypothetical protein
VPKSEAPTAALPVVVAGVDEERTGEVADVAELGMQTLDAVAARRRAKRMLGVCILKVT